MQNVKPNPSQLAEPKKTVISKCAGNPMERRAFTSQTKQMVKEWNEELEGKTFVDEGVKWIIYEVYKEKNRLVADYYDSKFANRSEEYIKNMTKPYSYLKEILRMSVNEDWFKPIYNEYLDPVKRK